MVALLESCLNYDLRPSSKDEDPPHAKIAADIVSCIFLNHHKKNVMKMAVPIAVKFLHRGNKELSRNLSSYLSLAAINNAELLAPHIQPIIDSIIAGRPPTAVTQEKIELTKKLGHVKCSKFMLKKFDEDKSKAVFNIITGDETWIYNFDPETKQQSTLVLFKITSS
ncbi:VEPH1 [Cordylochernes scorpioides]|uniref:VEPH1 n=1 Tax=Cordylochernes scorpioides TaxID=51811 RepID=A0ABY6KBZ7_9ARAC|nr:VEPH1 [Cordylochernes scorpioides]